MLANVKPRVAGAAVGDKRGAWVLVVAVVLLWLRTATAELATA